MEHEPDKSARQTVCVVCPCYDEAAGIGAFHRALKSTLLLLPDLDHLIIYVDDGSADPTLQELNKIAADDPTVLVYALSRNFGHQVALTAGCNVAGGDAIIMMDSDLQHPPELIAEMISRWRAGADVVSAVRHGGAGVSPIKRLASAGFYFFINLCSATPVVSGAADFCLLSRRAHQALLQMPERHRFLRGMVSWIGFRRDLVAYTAPPRTTGKSGYSLAKMIRLATDAIFSFSSTPIRLATRTGLFVALAGLIYLIYILICYFLRHDLVRGWGSLISVVLILGGLQLLFIGLIGEYVARIFEEVKGRPLYFFKQQPRRGPEISPHE